MRKAENETADLRWISNSRNLSNTFQDGLVFGASVFVGGSEQKAKMEKSYGWRPDTPDFRDSYRVSAPRKTELPASVDLRPHCPAIYDQGQLGSCTGNAIAAAIEFDQLKQGGLSFMPSRLFIYYNERFMEDTVDLDIGAQIRDGIKSVNKLGVCPEPNWPYNISRFKDRPTEECYELAVLSKSLSYSRVPQKLTDMKECLADGIPFVFGFSVYNRFENAETSQTGILNFPLQDEQLVGGHAVLAVGYDDSTQRFMVRNSWGKAWGMNGYFTMPYNYPTNSDLADDFWVIRTVAQQ